MKDYKNTIIEPTPEELKMYEANQEDEGYKDILRILGIVPSSLSEEQKKRAVSLPGSSRNRVHWANGLRSNDAEAHYRSLDMGTAGHE